jgi:hypothetical protein
MRGVRLVAALAAVSCLSSCGGRVAAQPFIKLAPSCVRTTAAANVYSSDEGLAQLPDVCNPILPLGDADDNEWGGEKTT